MTTPTTVNIRLQLRADTAANWTAANPILLANELGRETDTGKFKVGDGSTAWSSLAYQPWGSLITDADIAANAEIAVSKLANGTANQVIVTDGTNVSWSDDLTIAGNLTVNGTTTTVNTQTLVVEDKNIELGVVDTPTDVTADGGGITLKGATDKTINWIDATDSWTSSENIDLANGKSYRINGAEVLSATTLGSGVTSSSLTSVGTISAGTWQGTAIDAAYLDSTVVTTGDTGSVTSTMIADGTIVNADVSASAAIAGSKIDPDFGSQTIETTGDLAINTNTLFVDASANAVGIGTSSAQDLLHVEAGNGGGITISRNSITDNEYSDQDFVYRSGGTYYWTGKIRAIKRSGGGGDFQFFTSSDGTEPSAPAVVIDQQGRLAIGTTSPGSTLHVDASGGGILRVSRISSSASNYGQLEHDGSNVTLSSTTNTIFFNNSAERARIDSSGRLLVGTSSGFGSNYLQIQGDTGAAAGTGAISLRRGVAPASMGDGAFMGIIDFGPNDGGVGARIAGIADAQQGTNDYPSRLVFSTTSDGASSPTERMRIDSAGNVLIGTDTSTSGNFVQIRRDGDTPLLTRQASATAATSAYACWHEATSGNNVFISFYTETSAALRGTIDYNRGAGQVRYNVTSDRRLKSEIQSAGTALDALALIQVRSYKWTETGYQIDHGFIAQELNEVVPDAVKEGDDGDEVTDAWAVDNGKLVPLLTKALQEAIDKIEILEARLTALEAQ